METTTGLTSQQLQQMYPNVLEQVYFLPSMHFNQWNLRLASQVGNSTVYEPKPPLISERRGSEAEQRFLCSLQKLCNASSSGLPDAAIRPMFVLNGVNFENVLKKQTPKPARKKKKKRNRPEESETQETTGQKTQSKIKGEADFLIIYKSLGLVIIEVKAVGDVTTSQADTDKALKDVLGKVSKAHQSTEGDTGDADTASSMERSKSDPRTDKELFASQIIAALQIDMPVTYVVAFPNLTRADLERVGEQHQDFLTVLRRFGGGSDASTDLDILRTRCLCKEEFPEQFQYQDPKKQEDAGPRFAKWWLQFWESADREHALSEEDYEKTVAAFVGPYSEITVWSPKDKRLTSAGRCVHTQEDVIQEAGARYQMYVLYPQQLEVYSACHHKHVYLTGPPGCGKTLLMILKAAKWMSEGRYIVVVSTDYDNTQQQPVALETAQKIEETAKLQVNASSQSTSSATMGTVWLASTFGSNSPGDVVDRIARHLGRHKVQRQNAVFLIDEVMDDKFRAVAKKLRIKYPDSFIWTAGPWPSEKPSQFMEIELSPSLRCPPAIQQFLKDTESACEERHSYSESYCTSSTAAELSFLPTDGPPIQWLSHGGHPGSVQDCRTCGHALAQYLVNELHIGKGGRLEFHDVIIVTHGELNEELGLKEKGVTVKTVESGSGNQKRVAFPSKFVVATDISLALGLERMVVVFVPEGSLTKLTAVGEQRRGLRHRGGNPQSDLPHRRLEALGKDNRKPLWYILSHSLSHAIVFHFGEGVYTRENDSSEENESDENEESCSDDMADEEIEENRNAGESNVCVYAFVIVGLSALFFNLIIPSGYFLRRFI